LRAGKLRVYIGGIRSGKSEVAERIFSENLKGKRWKAAYLATVDSHLAKNDPGLKERVAAHQARRPRAWLTHECGAKLSPAPGCQAQLMDGLGNWLALRLQDAPGAALKELEGFLRDLKKQCRLAILVLDEVGQGGISVNRAQRRFADLNGLANQRVCAEADEVWRVDAGLVVRIK
jgi:adenosylcobinamide kinase/adenosylcobinamide-phosphate guanylyltransferase